VLLSSGDSFLHLIQKRRSQLGFVTYLLNYLRMLCLLQVMTTGGQLLSTGQLVVSGSNLAAQLASGKAQLATIGGQQVLIRTVTPGTNAVVVSAGTTVPALTSTSVTSSGAMAAATGNLLVKTVTTPVSLAQQQAVQV